jgi:hypothetical protein
MNEAGPGFSDCTFIKTVALSIQLHLTGSDRITHEN